MPTYVWFAAAAVGVGATLLTFWVWRVRSCQPATREEKLLAAKKAAAAMRRQSRRSRRAAFGSGREMGDRHSGAILENAVYGDAASAGGSDGGGGGSS